MPDVRNSVDSSVFYSLTDTDPSGNELQPCSGWTARLTAKLSPYVANDTAGATRRTTGAYDATGAISFMANDSIGPPFTEGDRVFLRLTLTDDLDDGYYEGWARISEISVDTTSQKDGGDNIGIDMSWEGDGRWLGVNLVAEGASSSA